MLSEKPYAKFEFAAIVVRKEAPVSIDLKLPVLPSRFSWILHGASKGPDDVFDEDLATYPEAAVIPTRGALIAEWLLVVPRTPCLSLAELDGPERARLLAIADDVSSRVSALTGAFVTFEHGPGRRGTAAACGVDQAHLHVVGGAPDLLDRLVERVDDVAWSAVKHADPWSAILRGSDYLMVRDRGRAVRALVNRSTSQRMRQAMADVLGRASEWDYRSHPNVLNGHRTKEMFRGAFANNLG